MSTELWALVTKRVDPRTSEILESWKPWGEPISPHARKRSAELALIELGRRSVERGYAGLTSDAYGLADDLLDGYVLTMDDGTSIQMVRAQVTVVLPD
ncbi:hypothetical protein [Rhodococcus qingshengii]|uniref:hypothetical protein n=1 Tax=Rhodococcus qingshengii TaxID=334542 RepID=UPI0035D9601B